MSLNERDRTMNIRVLLSLLTLMSLTAGTAPAEPQGKQEQKRGTVMTEKQDLPVAILAGGCFWCVEADFRKLPGMVQVISRYAGGHGPNPTYEDYARKGYVEAVQVRYDPSRCSASWTTMTPAPGGPALPNPWSPATFSPKRLPPVQRTHRGSQQEPQLLPGPRLQ